MKKENGFKKVLYMYMYYVSYKRFDFQLVRYIIMPKSIFGYLHTQKNIVA